MRRCIPIKKCNRIPQTNCRLVQTNSCKKVPQPIFKKTPSHQCKDFKEKEKSRSCSGIPNFSDLVPTDRFRVQLSPFNAIKLAISGVTEEDGKKAVIDELGIDPELAELAQTGGNPLENPALVSSFLEGSDVDPDLISSFLNQNGGGNSNISNSDAQDILTAIQNNPGSLDQDAINMFLQNNAGGQNAQGTNSGSSPSAEDILKMFQKNNMGSVDADAINAFLNNNNANQNGGTATTSTPSSSAQDILTMFQNNPQSVDADAITAFLNNNANRPSASVPRPTSSPASGQNQGTTLSPALAVIASQFPDGKIPPSILEQIPDNINLNASSIADNFPGGNVPPELAQNIPGLPIGAIPGKNFNPITC